MTDGTKAQGSDTLSVYMLGSHNDNIDLMDDNSDELEDSRDSAEASTVYAALDARLEAIEQSITAGVAGDGSLVSSGDKTPGYVSTKFEGLPYEITNPGGNETFRVHLSVLEWF